MVNTACHDGRKNVHRMYFDIPTQTFFKLLKRAKLENAFVDDNGWVDLGKLFAFLLQTYADGKYVAILDTSDKRSSGDDANVM